MENKFEVLVAAVDINLRIVLFESLQLNTSLLYEIYLIIIWNTGVLIFRVGKLASVLFVILFYE